MLVRISTIVFLTTAVSSIIFQSTTFALPKMFDERLQGIAGTFVAWINGWRAGSKYHIGDDGRRLRLHRLCGGLPGATRRRLPPRQAGPAHRVHGRGGDPGRLLRDHAGIAGMAGADWSPWAS